MRSRLRVTMRFIAAAGVLLMSGCAAGQPARPASSPAGPQTPAPSVATPGPPASPMLDGCFTSADGTIETVAGTGGETLRVGVVGTGPRVIVLSNESDEDLCSWLSLSARLAAAGYRVVLWDYGANLPTSDLASLVKRMRSSGATRIVLMGASEGAKTSLVVGAHITPAVQGVVSLSAESVLNPGIIVIDSVRRLRCPLLLVTARQDPYGSAQAARQFLAAAPSRAKQLLTVSGADHGTALMTGRSAATTLPVILAFLRRAAG